jgi:hypothetical protein
VNSLPDAQEASILFPRRYLLTGIIAAGKLVDAYYLDGRTYAESCPCGAPTAPGLVWCGPCAARVERLIAFAASRCLSCGDASASALCAACKETGERI